MKLEEKHIVYFLGIGGIGMSALARWFMAKKFQVAGYDKTPTDLSHKLQAEGMKINYTDTIGDIPPEVRDKRENTLVIYTPAIPKESVQLRYFTDHQYEIFKRSEVLGAISADHFTIAVAGTHGKTTTSSMIAHIFHTAGRKMVGFVGGILQNYNSNLIMDLGNKEETVMIVEADEYDRSFLQLQPDIAVVTAADPDHLDIYGTKEKMQEAYGEFINRIREGGKLFIKKGLKGEIILNKGTSAEIIEYNLEHSPIRAENIRIEKEELRFDYKGINQSIENVPLSQPGFYNVENALAAISVSLACGINESYIKQALSTYRGVKRRFEYIILSPEQVFIDDYAHHPEEIRAFLESVRSIFPEKYLLAVFQPHLFSRTRDLAAEFAESLSIADEVVLLDIYPAREKPLPGITSKVIYDVIRGPAKSMTDKKMLVETLLSKKFDVLVTIGAGDIDQFVNPIKEALLKKSETVK